MFCVTTNNTISSRASHFTIHTKNAVISEWFVLQLELLASGNDMMNGNAVLSWAVLCYGSATIPCCSVPYRVYGSEITIHTVPCHAIQSRWAQRLRDKSQDYKIIITTKAAKKNQSTFKVYRIHLVVSLRTQKLVNVLHLRSLFNLFWFLWLWLWFVCCRGVIRLIEIVSYSYQFFFFFFFLFLSSAFNIRVRFVWSLVCSVTTHTGS